MYRRDLPGYFLDPDALVDVDGHQDVRVDLAPRGRVILQPAED